MFFTADHHFYHSAIIDYCDRPFNDVEEMNEVLIDQWNSTVTKGDVVWHLGDFAMGSLAQQKTIFDRLNGDVRFIEGNHDKPNVLRSLKKSKQPYVYHLKDIKCQGQKITLCHYAMRVWNGSHYGTWQLFGHSHGTLGEYPLQFDVGVDNVNKKGLGYRPIHFDELKEIFDGC